MRTASVHEQAGELSQAEAIYRQLLQDNPAFDPAWHALGLLAFRVGKLPQAISCLEEALRRNDRMPLYYRNLGEICRRAGKLELAIASGEQACQLAPDNLEGHYNLALAYADASLHQRAVDAYQKALAIHAGHGLSWNNLGSAYEQLGQLAEAENAYRRAVAIEPGHAEAQNNLGALLSAKGQLDDARECFSVAIAARPQLVAAHYNLSSLKTYHSEDDDLTALEALYGQRERMSAHERIRYCFALGKAQEDIGNYDRAFAAYDEGNRLQHRLLDIDEARAERELKRVLAIFNEDFFSQRRRWTGAASLGPTPVFIVGMPRSGTTLLEQILSSHPSVFGAGELPSLHQAVYRVVGGEGRPFADGVAMLDETAMRAIGNDYLQRVCELAPQSSFITDKMPANFFYLGVLLLALPQAKIIHAMRDPMDSCFSCFSRLFNGTMDFAYDQGTLGRYYHRYMTLMTHWHRVLPAGTILDLPYERMVTDTEAQAKRVLDFVGLPWDPACLEFHKNDRLVKTASVAQVRRPIYQTSVARWKHFEGHLQPLYELVKRWR